MGSIQMEREGKTDRQTDRQRQRERVQKQIYFYFLFFLSYLPVICQPGTFLEQSRDRLL